MSPKLRAARFRVAERILSEHTRADQLLTELASDAEIRKEMHPWMVDFHGSERVSYTLADVKEMSPEELDRAVSGAVSELARKIRDWITAHGFAITDSGSGRGGWDLGVLCTDDEATRLCALAHAELGAEIASGVLQVSLKFWGWRFRDLVTREQAERICAERLH